VSNGKDRFPGKWWIAGSDNLQAGGILELGESFLLRTVEEIRSTLGLRLRDLGPVTINGQSAGHRLSLFDCHQESETFHPENVQQQIRALRVLEGPQHFADWASITVDRAVFCLYNLDTFANRRVFDTDVHASGVTINLTRPAILTATLPGGRLHLDRTEGYSLGGSLVRAEISSRECLVLELEDEVHIDDLFYRYLRPLQQLMSLATAEDCKVVELRVGRSRDLEETPGDYYSVHHWRQPGPDEQSVVTPNMRFSLDQQSARPHFTLAEVVPIWFSVTEKYGPALDLVFSLRSEIGYLESNLFAIACALESMHRKLFPESGKRTADQEARLQAILKNAPADHETWLKSALSRSHEPSFPARIKQLVDYAGEATARQFGDIDKWTRLVAAARNGIAHGRGLGNADAVGAVHLMQSMLMLAEVVLIRELGLSSGQRDDLVRRDFEWSTVRQRLVSSHPELFR
jgi:hypothetical protein